jgi:uncharacterized protein (TIGR02300 family)
MSKHIRRGTKRICQSPTCALPFYDLNRTDIRCPNCSAAFDAGVVLYPRRHEFAATPWKRFGRGAHEFSAARPSEAKPMPPQADEDDESPSAPDEADEAIDADADTLSIEDDANDEIADAVISPIDDLADR